MIIQKIFLIFCLKIVLIFAKPGAIERSYTITVTNDKEQPLIISPHKINCEGIFYQEITLSRKIEIGFQAEPDRYLKIVDVCFDDILETTLYTHFTLKEKVRTNTESRTSSTGVIRDHITCPLVNHLYKRETTRKTINKLLGLESNDTTYIENTGLYYLSRGHLIANADFGHTIFREATHHFINAAPQWQTFKGGNWAKLEYFVRSYPDIIGTHLEIYTGTYEIATLPHKETGQEIPLYLHDGDIKKIPVPLIFWKVVYDKTSKKGVAIAGINNPYLPKDQHPNYLPLDENTCNDIGFEWDKVVENNIYIKGYMYCSDVNALRRHVTNIPDDLHVTGLLLPPP